MNRFFSAFTVSIFCLLWATGALAGGEVWVKKGGKGVVFEYEGAQGGFGETLKKISGRFDVQKRDQELRVFFDADAPFSYVMGLRGALMKIGYSKIRCYVYVRDTKMMMEIPWSEAVPLPGG